MVTRLSQILEILQRLALSVVMLGVLSLGVALTLPAEKMRRPGKALRVVGVSIATGALALMVWLVLMRPGHVGFEL
jgi:hypothetical protein